MNPVINLAAFEKALLFANADMHQYKRKAEAVFGVAKSNSRPVVAKQGDLKGKWIQMHIVCHLTYLYIDPIDYHVKLAFNSFNTGFVGEQWVEVATVKRLRERSTDILLRPLPWDVEAYFLSRNFTEAQPHKDKAEDWLHRFYSQLAEGLSNERYRQAAQREADRVAKSLEASQVFVGLPADVQQQIQQGV